MLILTVRIMLTFFFLRKCANIHTSSQINVLNSIQFNVPLFLWDLLWANREGRETLLMPHTLHLKSFSRPCKLLTWSSYSGLKKNLLHWAHSYCFLPSLLLVFKFWKWSFWHFPHKCSLWVFSFSSEVSLDTVSSSLYISSDVNLVPQTLQSSFLTLWTLKVEKLSLLVWTHGSNSSDLVLFA